MMRRGRPEILGRSLTDFYEDAEARAFIVERRAHFDEPWESEFHLPMPDGSQLPVIVSSRVLGRRTTLGVVQSIFLVIFADAIFAVVFVELDF